MSERSPAYLLDWDPARVWDADFNIWLDPDQYGLMWSPGVTDIPQAVVAEGALTFHGVLDVVADDDYPVNDVGWSVVSEHMLEVLRAVGDFPHEVVPIEVVNARHGDEQPAVDGRFSLLHVTEHLDDVLDERATVALRAPEGMLSAPSAFRFRPEALAQRPLPPFFRLSRYPWAPFVSEAAREALMASGVRSLRFVPCTRLFEAHFRSQLLDPWALHKMVNDGDKRGLDRYFRVLRTPNCDRATALSIYWRHRPSYFRGFEHEGDIPPSQRGFARLVDAAERRYVAGMYKLSLLHFDPRDDEGVDLTGSDDAHAKRGGARIPPLMCERVGSLPVEALPPESRLHRLVSRRDRRAVQELLMREELDLDVVDNDEHGDTALHIAVRHDAGELVELLLLNGADPNTPNRLRHTAVHLAAAQGARGLVEVLLDAGADVDALAHSDRPIQVAARCGHADVVRVLMDRGAKLAGDSLNQLLRDACTGRNLEVLRLLVAKGADVHATNARGDSALVIAASVGWAGGVRALIQEAGARVDQSHSRTGQTPLHAASRADQGEAVQELLSAGARPDATDHAGRTCLHVALIARSRQAVVRLLALSSPDEATAALAVALDWEGSDNTMVELLLSHGASRSEALRQAVTRGGSGLVASVIETVEPEDLNRCDALGRTLLHIASGCGEREAPQPERVAIVDTLVDAGAVVDPADVHGATPLTYASIAGLDQVVDVLLRHGADAQSRIRSDMEVGSLNFPAGSSIAECAQRAGQAQLAERLRSQGS